MLWCVLTVLFHFTVECYARLLSHVQLFATPWTVAHQAPLPTGILQATVLEWVVMSSCRGSSQPSDQTQVSTMQAGSLLSCSILLLSSIPHYGHIAVCLTSHPLKNMWIVSNF